MTDHGAKTEIHPHPGGTDDPGPQVAEDLGQVRNITLLASLGQGGMGEVFVGEDKVLGRRVAVKCLRPGLLQSPVARHRFLREARLLSQLEHPNICRVYDFVNTPRGDFLVMELVEGHSLEATAPTLDLEAKLRIAMQIAKALSAAHQQGIVHRDLKPQNVMVDADGDAKVLDFGLARLWNEDSLDLDAGPEPTDADSTAQTEAGLILGSPPYMSPEQARGEPLTPRSDLYSLGILLQELIEGRRVYERGGLRAIIFKVQMAEARPMVAGGSELIGLVEGLKSLEPGSRPSAEAVHDRLLSILDAPRRRRNRVIVAAAIFALLLGIAKYTVDLRKERQLALEAQARAENLIGFMVDDLYRGLEPLGRLDLLEAAADSATGYYEQFGSEGVDADQWFRRAWALRNSGRVLEYQGRYGKALSAYRQSANSLSGLLETFADHPQVGEWRRAQANTLALAGRVLQEQGKLAESLELRSQTLAMRRQFEKETSPEDRAQRQHERWVEEAEVAWLLREMNRHEEALAQLDSILEEIAAEDRDLRRITTVVLSYRGTTEFERQHWQEAYEDFSRAHQLDQELYRESGNPGRQLALLMTTSRVGEAFVKLGRDEEAVETFRAARDLGLELVAKDPLNAEWKRELAVTHTNLAEAWRNQQRFPESLVESKSALAISRRLFEGDPSNASYRNDVAFDLTAIGVTHQALGDGDAARTAWQEAVDLVEPLVSDVAEPSGFYLASLAEALLRLDRLDQARAALDELAARGWNDPELERLARERGWHPAENS